MTAGTFQFRPICKQDFDILRRLNSPIYQRIQQGLNGEQTTDAPTPYTATEACEIVFLFTRPVRTVEQVLKRGRGNFRFAAACAIHVNYEAESAAIMERIQSAIVRFANTAGKECII